MSTDLVFKKFPYLFQLETVRERALAVYDYVAAGHSKSWQIDLGQLSKAVELTETLTEAREAQGPLPYHSRLRHFEVSRGLYPKIAADLENLPEDEQGRSWVELVIMSVLTDAGAGHHWKFVDIDGLTYNRSEGLAVAGLSLYASGILSSLPEHPYRIDPTSLAELSLEAFEKAFQTDASNPMVGSEGRLRLLQRLGTSMEKNPSYFFNKNTSSYRLGFLYDALKKRAQGKTLSLREIFKALIVTLRNCWPVHSDETTGFELQGDLWFHPALQTKDPEAPLMPFHKLSQWLCYSLWEVFERQGFTVSDTELLTGLPEYRNGGLLMDTGVLSLKNPKDAEISHPADSLLVIEWRALTVILLDKLHKAMNEKRKQRGQAPLKLAQALEGGTWAAGRKIAREKRGELANPPLKISSDGTVF